MTGADVGPELIKKIDAIQSDVHDMKLELVSRWAEVQAETNAAAEKIKLYISTAERVDQRIRDVHEDHYRLERRVDATAADLRMLQAQVEIIASSRVHWSRWLGQAVGGALLLSILGLLLQQGG